MFRGGDDLRKQCENGYQGPLCGLCETHFAKVDNMCIECSSKIINITTILSILLIYFLFLFLFLGLLAYIC